MISIIIPAYNRASLLKYALDSVVRQSSPEWECIVVDDFSKDNTKNVVDDYKQDNIRISYYLNEHKKGAQGARNTGLEKAKHEWIMFFDSDNIMHPNFIEKILPFLKDGVDVCACCSSVVDVDKGITELVMNPRCYGNIHGNLFSGKSYVDFNHSIIRKSKLYEIGCLDEDCPSMQEWDTHIRLSNICWYFTVEECLIDYYIGGKDAISSDKKREVEGRLYILKKFVKEWRKRPISITKYSYQIKSLIMKNEDEVFIEEKKAELKSLVPYLNQRCFLYALSLKVCSIKYILRKFL